MRSQHAESAREDRLLAFHRAIRNTEPVSGLTHTFYRYPACFSPVFARTAIRAFSRRGDLVLDPFMGGGTTLVEAIAEGRHSLGTDINSLAHFIARVKTSVLESAELREIDDWVNELADTLNLRESARPHAYWRGLGYQRNLPWPVRKMTEQYLSRVESLATAKSRQYARCIMLRLGQWALDSRNVKRSAEQLRAKLLSIVSEYRIGMEQLRLAVASPRPKASCLHGSACDLDQSAINRKASLVVTSPPYPGVYVLYHRWKVRGRKESPAPYWIADCHDGQGQAHYCFGDRRQPGLTSYFAGIESAFTGVRKLVTPNALVVQMLAFSEPKWQLPEYLTAMRNAGFAEVSPAELGIPRTRRLRRDVPGRRWFALVQDDLATSREVVLFHRPS